MTDGFHHPYYFVPTPNRPEPKDNGPLSDHDPRLTRGHHRLHGDLWTGRIAVEMTTETPLLIPDIPPVPDAEQQKRKDEKRAVPLRFDAGGNPLLPVTTIRGALSAAFEIVTNSRFRVFRGHEEPLSRRVRDGSTTGVRKFYRRSPLDLLDWSLRPAADLADLSPADRVFGWVGQNGGGGWRGLLRIGKVGFREGKCRRFDPALPLATLSTPKPLKGWFYLADSDGAPFADGTALDDTDYDQDRNRLRGRKVYPHQIHPEGYWEPYTENGEFDKSKGYVHPKDKLDKGYRPLGAWVEPGATFAFDIEVTNLSDVELGALLWLLGLDEKHFLKVGGGKPFGFGSVRMIATKTELAKGTAWRTYYLEGLGGTVAFDKAEPKIAIEAFRSAVLAAYGGGEDTDFESIPFIATFLRAAQGVEPPIHYPLTADQRDRRDRDVRTKQYEWFVANEKGAGVSLPEITATDPTLPYLEASSGSTGGGSSGGNAPESNELFVKNIEYSATEDELRKLFSKCGQVTLVKLPTDRDTGRPLGQGYVHMGSIEEARTAISTLHDHEFKGRPLRVGFARPRK